MGTKKKVMVSPESNTARKGELEERRRNESRSGEERLKERKGREGKRFEMRTICAWVLRGSCKDYRAKKGRKKELRGGGDRRKKSSKGRKVARRDGE